MFGSLPEGDYHGDIAHGFGSLPDAATQGDLAHGFGSLPDAPTQGDLAHGFGERGGDSVWSNIQQVGLGAVAVQPISPSDLKATPPLNKVLDYGDAVYVRVMADNVKDAADKAALVFEGFEVVEPYVVKPCPRRRGVFHVKAAKADVDGMGRLVKRGRSGTGGNKPLTPRQVNRYLRGKPVRISRRGNRISVYGLAPNRDAALRRASAAAERQKVRGVNFTNAVPLGLTPAGKLWQVNGRIGSARKASAESAAEMREQARTVADTAAKIAIEPVVQAFDDAMQQGASYEEATVDASAYSDDAYVEARYQAAVEALMSDSFGGLPMENYHGSYTDGGAFGGIPMENYHGSYTSEMGAIPMENYHGSYTDELGSSCGC